MAKSTAVYGGAGCGTACILSTVDKRYYLARRTLMEMLRDRGYVVANMEAELCRSLARPNASASSLGEPLSHRGRYSPYFVKLLRSENEKLSSQIVNKETLDRISDLLVNITKHFPATKHEILAAEEKEKLRRTGARGEEIYGHERTQLRTQEKLI
ncbi:DNA-directed RNA polymerase V subunitC [Sesamum alatum]|uniref:DNA-directed RNA polymerase V subunitC n=1 Tax=Sesamum alatum TaxID=300844 RepID=A0AAE1Y6C1_9LAMI|nr:DNA-directed RNA polymerase V subunitC [Sesamum alatum]